MKKALVISIFTLLVLSLMSHSVHDSEAQETELNSTHEELGTVNWQRDFDTAKTLSKESNKPILILFQEVPGCSTCRNYGHNVLSNPLLVEAIEELFVPLAIFNNEGGKDKEVLERFNEPSWNNPVVRIIDSEENGLSKRVARNYSAQGLYEAMINALNASKISIPKYLETLGDELSAEDKDTEVAYYKMYCFWSGEGHLGQAEGVLDMESGFSGSAEVVKVTYDKDVITEKELAAHATDGSCASIETTKFTESEKDTHYYLKNSAYRFIPLSSMQQVKINTALGTGDNPSAFLSPQQLEWFLENEKKSESTKTDYSAQDFEKAWLAKSKG